MEFEIDRKDDKWGEPSLTEMVDTAINILSRSAKGYFLLVEGKGPNLKLKLSLDLRGICRSK